MLQRIPVFTARSGRSRCPASENSAPAERTIQEHGECTDNTALLMSFPARHQPFSARASGMFKSARKRSPAAHLRWRSRRVFHALPGTTKIDRHQKVVIRLCVETGDQTLCSSQNCRREKRGAAFYRRGVSAHDGDTVGLRRRSFHPRQAGLIETGVERSTIASSLHPSPRDIEVTITAEYADKVVCTTNEGNDNAARSNQSSRRPGCAAQSSPSRVSPMALEPVRRRFECLPFP